MNMRNLKLFIPLIGLFFVACEESIPTGPKGESKANCVFYNAGERGICRKITYGKPCSEPSWQEFPVDTSYVKCNL